MKNNSKNLVKMNETEALLTLLRTYKNEKKYKEAAAAGLSALKLLGIAIKVNPSMFSVLREINRTKKLFTMRRIKRIPTLKAIQSQEAMLQLTLLSELAEPALMLNENLWHMVLMRIARISVKKGNSDIAAIGYAGFAMIAVQYLEDDQLAERMYHATMKLLDKQDDHRTSAIAKFILGAFVCHIYNPWIESLRLLDEGAKDAMNGCEPVVGGLCLSYGIEMAFASGIAMSELQLRISKARDLGKESNSQALEVVMNLYEAFIDCVTYDDADDIPQLDVPVEEDPSFHMPLHHSAVMLRIVLSYNHERYAEALKHIDGLKKELGRMRSHYIAGIVYGYEVLSMTAIAHEATRWHRREIKRRVSYLKSLYKYRVKKNAYNYGQMYKIVVACSAQLSGDFYKGEVAFEKAIELSEKKGALLDQAVAIVALARHCRTHGKEHMAVYYMMEGASVFDAWQGNTISRQLLTSEKIHLPHEEVKDRWELPESDRHTSVAGRAMELTERLTCVRKRLLLDYCYIVSDTMNCEKVFVFLDHSGVLNLEAMTGVSYESGTTCDSMTDVSVKVIKQVFRNNDHILVNSDKGHALAKYDGYIMDHGTGCILSVPLAYNGSVIGVLYAERSEDFLEDDCGVVKRLTEHVSYLWVKDMTKDNNISLPKLSESEQVIFDQVRVGRTIKEISDMYSTPLNQVLIVLSDLYKKLKVDNLYEMRQR